jgi:hypothetical protein
VLNSAFHLPLMSATIAATHSRMARTLVNPFIIMTSLSL